MTAKKILVVGADSKVGIALTTHLQLAGEKVIGTTRRDDAAGRKKLFLDLSSDTKKWKFPDSIETAVILAGVTNISQCQDNPKQTRIINVDGIESIVDNFVSKGVFVIYVSTPQVFDGTIPFGKPDAPLSPVSEYGKQKAEVETYLKNLNDKITILRSTKIFDINDALYQGWISDLKSGKVIHPFSHMTISHVTLNCVVTVLRAIIDKKRPGIFQVSGTRNISYEKIAYLLANSLNLNKGLIKPISKGGSLLCSNHFPKYASFNIDRIRNVFGIEPVSVEWVIESLKTQTEM